MYSAKLRSNLQNGLCFGGKIERILRLVIVQPLESIPIVEESRSTSPAIRDYAVKPPIQPAWKVRLIFITMD
jgi:hypothetical protein